ncbi:MAG: hypothetical protein K1X94_26505 [Sandaracinaceae bacterium]|nr:hypothetical protein [Sandaracinaceae bacterium]
MSYDRVDAREHQRHELSVKLAQLRRARRWRGRLLMLFEAGLGSVAVLAMVAWLSYELGALEPARLVRSSLRGLETPVLLLLGPRALRAVVEAEELGQP